MSAAVSLVNASIVKTCPCCGRNHDAHRWASLPFVGTMASDTDGIDLELRNCACDSTIAIEVPGTPAAALFVAVPEEDRPPCYAPEGVSAEEEARCAANVARWRAERVRR